MTVYTWVPAKFFLGVGKLGGLELPSPNGVHNGATVGVPEMDKCFENNA